MGPQQREDQQRCDNQKRDAAGKQLVLICHKEKAGEQSQWIAPEKQRTA
jgi:hypothetical protein